MEGVNLRTGEGRNGKKDLHTDRLIYFIFIIFEGGVFDSLIYFVLGLNLIGK